MNLMDWLILRLIQCGTWFLVGCVLGAALAMCAMGGRS